MILAIAGLLSTTVTAGEKGDAYTVNTDKSEIKWTGKKVTGEHMGTLNLKEGELIVKDGMITGGSFIADMTTIVSTDLEGEYKGKLEGHLKSEDFFHTAEHPHATFKISSVKQLKEKGKNGSNYEITGDLTIKGITQTVSFPAIISFKDDKLVAIGFMTIDRTKFNVKYGSGQFFDDLGDKTIYDDFELQVRLAASK